MPQHEEIDPNVYRRWTPAAQEAALQRLHQVQQSAWRPFYCQNLTCDGAPHDNWKWNHARADQRPPQDKDWLVWLLMSGRGAGKTRAGTEWTHRMVKKVPRIALVGATGADVRDVILEGEAGILTLAAPGERPNYEPSKRRLTWPNGAIASLYSAEEPDRLRGPEHFAAWLDEAAFYALVQEVWDNLMFGLRMGKQPRVVVTTTPKPRAWLKDLIVDERTRLSRATTYDNLANLSPVFAERVIKRYEGTRLGRQELHAELLTDVEGALWTWEMIEQGRIVKPPDDMQRIVIGLDPAGTRKTASDETGIVVVGYRNGETYILADRSGHYSPHGWASVTRALYEEFEADAVIAETNYGGEMVTHTLRTSGVKARVITVSARRNKSLRAEPVVGLYEQGKVHHCGAFPELESQLTEWVPFDADSPDRLDALVYAVSYVAKGLVPARVASPLQLVQ
jgi:phage terminase large subunit-like protein